MSSTACTGAAGAWRRGAEGISAALLAVKLFCGAAYCCVAGAAYCSLLSKGVLLSFLLPSIFISLAMMS